MAYEAKLAQRSDIAQASSPLASLLD